MEEERECLSDSLTVRYGWEGKKVDGFLQKLVNLANVSGIEMGLTLTVDGAVITGLLISTENYFKEFAALFSGAFPGGDPDGGLRRSFESLGTPKAGDDEFPRQFISLKNAYYVTGNNHLPQGGMLWRGKISSVSGFSLGNFQPS